jgi:uncharacterized protein YfaS (alpha-2-macroglobulin family)
MKTSGAKAPFSMARLCSAKALLHPFVLLAFVLMYTSVCAAERAPYFSLTTNKSFAPGEKITVSVHSEDVDALEFRVYRIDDPAKFFVQLGNVHQFGKPPAYEWEKERIDEKTWLEKFDDWKRDTRRSIRDFFRHQFDREARAKIREKQQSRPKKTTIINEAQFAQVPILNHKQLIGKWRQVVPRSYYSGQQALPMAMRDSGAYLVEATDGKLRAYTVVIVSRTVLVTKTANHRAVAFLVDRNSGAPIQNAGLTFWIDKDHVQHGATDASGLAQFDAAANIEQVRLIAVSGSDVAVVSPESYYFGETNRERNEVYVYTDRPVYRPGHTTHIKAVVRVKNGDRLEVPRERQIQLRVVAPGDKRMFAKQVTLSNVGTAYADFDVPNDAPLGDYRIEIGTNTFAGSFYVEEYKKPEYEVKVMPVQQRVLQGEPIKATFDSRYFFGEPVANAKVAWVVHTSPHYNWDYDADDEYGYREGDEGDGGSAYDYDYGGTQEEEQHGTLDANGKMTVSIPTRVDDKNKRDLDYRIEARVTDAANREISGHAKVLATYGQYILNVRPESYVYREGQTPRIIVTANDYDNKPVQTTVHLAMSRPKWWSRNHGDKGEDFGERDVTTGADGIAMLEWPLKKSGSYEVKATAQAGMPAAPSHESNVAGRQLESVAYVWIAGAEVAWGGTGERKITLVADKKTYKPGDVAKILVSTGLQNSYVLITAEGTEIQSHQVIEAKDGTATFELLITTTMQPNIYVNATAVHDGTLYQGAVNVKVPPDQQRLTIEITPSKPQFQPGEKATYDLLAKDANGNPARAELSIGVVDEAIYSVRPETTGDVLSTFYPKRWKLYDTASSLDFYFTGHAGNKAPMLALNELKYSAQSGRMAQVKGGDLVQPKVRKAFPDTAYWSPAVITDASGRARVSVDFPDSLTSWRTTVRAITADTKGGSSIARVIVRKNLMVRFAAPRFFRQGDEVTVSTIVHNYLQTPKTVRMSLDATGVQFAGDHAARDVNVPSRGEAKVDWRLHASAVGGGSAVLTAKALTNEESDAMEITLPVKAFGVRMGIPKSGTIGAQSGSQKTDIVFPTSDPQSHSIDVTLSSSVAGPIFSALDYLATYPYGCTEQTMSSFLPDIILAQTTSKLKLKTTVPPADLNKMIRAGLERLYDYQHSDGGWGWWKEDESHVFMTAYVVGGLSQAKDAGYDVDQEKIAKAKDWLRKTLREHPNMIADLEAYVVYALELGGERSTETRDRMWSKRGKFSAQGWAHAGLAMHLAGDARAKEAADALKKSVEENEQEAYWKAKNDYLLDIYDFDDSPETTAVALKLLTAIDPQNPLLPKVAQWLVAHRDEGYWWMSTKQTANVVFGLTDYLVQSHEFDANFTADVLLNGKVIATKRFAVDSTMAPPVTMKVDAAALNGANGTVEVRKSGAGRLYWSARGNYYSTQKRAYQTGSLKLNVARDFYRLRSVRRSDKIVYALDPLNGPVQVGDVLAIHLTVSGDDWKYLLIEDPIPAGTEFIEKDDLYELESRPRWWSWAWRREFHDDRAAFFNYYMRGAQDYYYLLKVVNPGVFEVSPTLVQPMYQPKVMATGDSMKVEAK